jgi:hypothetical protein
MYTERYISKHFIYIINEYLQTLDKQYNLSNKIYSIGEKTKDKMEKRKFGEMIDPESKIIDLLKSIEKHFNKPTPVLQYTHYYIYETHNIIVVPIYKTGTYNISNFYHPDLNYNNDNFDLIIRYNPITYKFTNININRMPKIKTHSGFSGNPFAPLVSHQKTPLPVLPKVATAAPNFGECVFNINIPVENKISNEIDCVNIGGYWDKRCSKDSECPFYDGHNGKCNINTGHCSMPRGIEKIGYTLYNTNSYIKAKCINNKNKIVDCATLPKGVKYNYKWEKET